MYFSNSNHLAASVEVLNENGYTPIIHFGKGAFFTALSNGSTELNFIIAVFNYCENLKKVGMLTNFRIRVLEKSNTHFFLRSNTPPPSIFSFNNSDKNFESESECQVDLLIATNKFLKLTLKEKKVFYYLLEGYDKNTLFKNLGISENTFRGYRKIIFEKLEIHSLMELIHWAEKNKLIRRNVDK